MSATGEPSAACSTSRSARIPPSGATITLIGREVSMHEHRVPTDRRPAAIGSRPSSGRPGLAAAGPSASIGEPARGRARRDLDWSAMAVVEAETGRVHAARSWRASWPIDVASRRARSGVSSQAAPVSPSTHSLVSQAARPPPRPSGAGTGRPASARRTITAARCRATARRRRAHRSAGRPARAIGQLDPDTSRPHRPSRRPCC